MNHKKSGSRTLLWSVIMSGPGPLVVGFGLLSGRSVPLLADFVRRSAELLALIMAFVTYRLTTQDGTTDTAKKEWLERFSNRFVGAMICVGGAIMLLLALFSENTDKGKVLPGLSIALMGVVANTLFLRKYTQLHKIAPNPILAVQVRLYRTKSLVDGCVTCALLSVAVFPSSLFAYYFDLIGSLIVTTYLIFCGGQTIRERLQFH